MSYLLIKQVHIACVLLSIAGFLLRGILMLRDSPLLHSRIARIAPHVVDTVLLASAIALAWMSGQYPFAQGWLTAKVLALVAYIALGTVALKRGRGKAVRAAAFALALAAVSYIVCVALTRNPLGPFAAF
ncbi:MAG: SirB2 family protein [Betaproteobacteria bacterium]